MNYVILPPDLGRSRQDLQDKPINPAKQAQNQEKNLHFCRFSGADGRIRTGDLILTKDALYRLSYISAFTREQVVL